MSLPFSHVWLSHNQSLSGLPSVSPAFLLATGLVLLPFLLKRWRQPRRLPLPPGPRGIPIMGNFLQMPSIEPWKVYYQWAKERYGDIIYLNAAGEEIILLNSLSAAVDLLEKKAGIFSSRQWLIAFDLIGLSEWVTANLPYGAKWRSHRRSFHQFFNAREVQSYRPVIEQEGIAHARRLATNPKNFLLDSRYLFGILLLKISYGSSDDEYNKQLLANSHVVVKSISESLLPGAYLVNTFPWLRHFPSWFPGTGWKQKFAKFSAASKLAVVDSLNDTKARLRAGVQDGFPSIAARLIENLPDESHETYEEQLNVARAIAVNGFVAGSDTTVISMYALYLALAMRPEVQKRAQEEIDSVVGSDRLPTFNDFPRLPYVQAIMKEVSRWHTVVPLGLNHVSTEEYEYNGYRIPKGSSVLVNVWGIMHDPEIYEDPFEFKPERFLKDGKIDPSVLDPEAAIFGFGRR
ncbi:cytochrome P450 [Coprinopsis cinerea AmutBmut pab1-1]|nr:cytochrome P450 [Coprinopsis cinerea AmutBmut pab1-1]